MVIVGLIAGLQIASAPISRASTSDSPTGANMPASDTGAGSADQTESDDPALRTQFSDATLNTSTGEVDRQIYQEPVNYKDDQGAWQPIDSALVGSSQPGYAAENAANSFDVLIPDNVDNKPVKVADDSGWVTFNPVAAQGAPDVSGDSATFDGPNPSTSFAYQVDPTGLKESIVLAQAPATAPTYHYALNVSAGLTPRLESDGSISVVDGDGNLQYTIPAPTMTDSSLTMASLSTAVAAQLTNDSSGWTLTLTPDYSWLTDPARVYPVSIDPTVVAISVRDGSGEDCWIDQAAPTTQHCLSGDPGSSYLYVGQDATGKSRRSLLKFDVSSIPSNANISVANMQLYVDGLTHLNGQNATYGVKQMLKPWSNNVTWNQRNASGGTWGQNGGQSSVDYDPTNIDLSSSQDGHSAGTRTFTITSLVSQWVNNGVANDGVMIKQDPENVDNYFAYTSGDQGVVANRPVLNVTYTVPSITNVGMSPCQVACTYPQSGGLWSTGSAIPTFTVDVSNPGSSPNNLDVAYSLCAGVVVSCSSPLVTDTDDVTRSSASNPFDESSWTVPPADASFAGLQDGGTYTLVAAVSDPQRGASPSVAVSFLVRKSVRGAFTVYEPLKITDHGAELHWGAYHNNTGDPNSDLYQYQVFRGCLTLPTPGSTGNGCANPVTSPANLGNAGQWQEITATSGKTGDTGIDASQRTFTDTSAQPSTSAQNATYQYLVVAQTVADHQAQLNGEFLSTTQNVTTPLAGHVREIFTGDAPQAVVDHLPLAMLSQSKPATVVGDPNGHPWFEVGDASTEAGLGATHAVMQFDTSDIDPGLPVMSAQLQLTQTSGGGTGSDTFQVWDLGQGFDDSTATWTYADGPTLQWEQPTGTLSPGGTTAGTVLDTFTTTSTHTGVVTAAQSVPFASAVQGWINDPTTNDGLLLRASNDAAASQWVAFDANGVGDSTLQPRLVVDYLSTPKPTFTADTMPVRFAPDTITMVQVKVTNTTSNTWDATTEALKLGYMWTDPDGTTDDLLAASHRTVAVPTLQPGESTTLSLPVVAPARNTSTANLEQSYDLVIDLIKPDGTFTSLTGGSKYAAAYPSSPSRYPTGASERADSPCLMVAPNSPRPGGLDCLARVVDGTTDPIGLETSLSYTGQNTGAGSELLLNNHDGNVIWNYDAWQVASAGPSSFVTATYNTQDTTTPSGTARGWSFTVGTLNRLGDNPKVSASDGSVSLVDGDGTQHIWASSGTTAIGQVTYVTYAQPPGVHLTLVHAQGSNAFAFVRPDGTKFNYSAASTGNTLVPTTVVDRDGNTLTFTTNAANEVTQVTDAAGRDVADLTWDNTNGNSHLTSIAAPSITTSDGTNRTRTLQLTYNESPRSSGKDDVTSLLDCGDTPSATTIGGQTTYTCASATVGHLFKFNYCPPTGSCVSNAGPLYSVTDPKNDATTVSYYSSTDQTVRTNRTLPAGLNVSGWPKTITTRTGRQIEFEYYPATDNSGDVQTNVYAQSVNYDLASWQGTATWAETRRLTDAFGRDIAVMDPVNSAAHAGDPDPSPMNADVTQLVWDADNNVISLTEPGPSGSLGARTKWTYDQTTGYPIKQFDPTVLARGGSPTKLAYQTVSNAVGPASFVFLKSITTPIGHVTTFTRTASGDLKTVTDAGANKGPNTITYSYGSFPMLPGHSVIVLQSMTDANGNVTTYGYDQATASATGGATGQPTTITPPSPTPAQQGSSPAVLPTTLTYNPVGGASTSSQGTGASARTSRIAYDGLWRPVTVTAPGAQGNLARTTTTSYDANDNVTSIKAANGGVTSYDYDAADRVIATHLPSNNGIVADRQQSTVYDIAGNLICSYAPLYTGPRTGSSASTCAINTGSSIAHSTAYLPDLDGRVRKSIQLGSGGPLVTSGTYNPDTGNLTSVTDARNNSTSYGYDPDHRVTSVTDPAQATTRTKYDNDGRLQDTVDADGNPTDYGYYPNGSRKSVTAYRTPTGSNDTQANTTTYQYDHNGNLTKTILPSGRFTQTLYDQNGNPYEEDGLRLPTTAPADLSITYLGYDTFGELARQSLPTGGDKARPADTGAGFDPKQWTQYAYYTSGDIQSSTDPFHVITSYEFNKIGLQTSRTIQGSDGTQSVDQSRSMSWAYNPDGSLRAHDDTATLAPTVAATSVTLLGAANWQSRSDGAHYLTPYYVHAASSGSDSAAWTYQPTSSNSLKLQIACPQQTGGGDNPATSATYTITTTSGGQPLTLTATLDQSKCDGDQLWYTPNVNTSDNQIPATSGQAVTVTLKTSSGGSVVADSVRFTAPAKQAQYTYSYDADGNQTLVDDNTLPAPVTGSYISCYDDFDRLAKVLTAAATNGTCNTTPQLSTAYSYDANSNVTQVASNLAARTGTGDDGNTAYTSTTSYTWDNRNLLASVTAANKNDVDSNGNPLFRTWSYTYNSRGQLQTMTKPSVGYTAGGNQVAGNLTSYSYFEDGLLQSSTETQAGHSTVIDRHQLSYDPDGNPSQDILTIAAPTVTQHQTANYSYDDAGRIKTVSKHDTDSGYSESYKYFPDGSISTQAIGPNTTTNHEDRGRLTDTTTTGQPTQWDHYDAFGRLHTITSPTATSSAIATYEWDGFDRLVHENSTPNGSSSSIDKNTSFDPFDRPTLSIATGPATVIPPGPGPTKKTRYDYVGLTKQVAAEEQPTSGGGTSWQVVRTYTDDPAGRSLALTNTPLGPSSPNTVRYYTFNPHTDTEALTNPSTGAVTQVYRYLAYGSLDTRTNGSRGAVTTGEDTNNQPTNASSDNDILNPYRYNDERADVLTGNYDMGFRTYSTSISQFLSRDMYNGALDDMSLSLDPWGVDRYTLGAGNPISNVELDGHMGQSSNIDATVPNDQPSAAKVYDTILRSVSVRDEKRNGAIAQARSPRLPAPTNTVSCDPSYSHICQDRYATMNMGQACLQQFGESECTKLWALGVGAVIAAPAVAIVGDAVVTSVAARIAAVSAEADASAAGGDVLATEANLSRVTAHLETNGYLVEPENQAMIARLQEALGSGRDLSVGEQNFMTHELTEAQLMDEGVPSGLAHDMALETHPPYSNYDPDVVKQFPERFNSNWRAYWGIE